MMEELKKFRETPKREDIFRENEGRSYAQIFTKTLYKRLPENVWNFFLLLHNTWITCYHSKH